MKKQTLSKLDLKWAIARRRREEGGFNGWEKIKELIALMAAKKKELVFCQKEEL